MRYIRRFDQYVRVFEVSAALNMEKGKTPRVEQHFNFLKHFTLLSKHVNSFFILMFLFFCFQNVIHGVQQKIQLQYFKQKQLIKKQCYCSIGRRIEGVVQFKKSKS